MVVGTSVVDTAAIAGDEEIVVVVWVTVVVVEVSIDGASAMTPVEMVGWYREVVTPVSTVAARRPAPSA